MPTVIQTTRGLSRNVREAELSGSRLKIMKVYTIIPVNFEYNDETYDAIGFQLPVKIAYRSLKSAQEEFDRLTKKFNKKFKYMLNGKSTSFVIQEVEIADNDASTYDALRQVVGEARIEMLKAGKEYFQNQAKALFSKWPQLEGFSISAYTPYFADGAECVYGVGDARIKLKGFTPDDEDCEDGYTTHWGYQEDLPKDAITIQDAVERVIESIDAEIFKELFGDHIRITVTRKGIDVSDYEHY